MAFQEVCIIGATGNIGSELIRQIVEYDQAAKGHPNPTRIVGMVNSQGYILDASGIPDPLSLLNRQRFQLDAQRYETLDGVLDAAHALGLECDIVYVDATADRTENMLRIHNLIVDTRQRIVTANKNPLALFSTKDFRQLTSHRTRYAFNASVMAGADAVPFLQDSYDISDPVESIEGCYSGTNGFITSALEDGQPFSQALRSAYEQKFTEPNPWDDLSGIDVARKLVILARSAGYDVSMQDVQLNSFIPEKYGSLRADELLTAVEAEDIPLQRRVSAARVRGNVLRYVAAFMTTHGNHFLSVDLREVAKESPLGRLRGSANLVKIETQLRAPADNPHIIQSKGAGIRKTAAALRADLLRFLPDLDSHRS